MNRSKKPIFFAITLVVVGLMISVNASTVSKTENLDNVRTINWNLEERSLTSERISVSKPVKMQTSSMGKLSADPLYSGEFPALDSNGQIIILGFENYDEENVYFSFSANGGTTWDEGAYGWILEAMPEKPSIAYSSGNTFYGVVVPNWEVSGQVTLAEFIDGSDPDTWQAGTWDWEDDGIYGFDGASMASAEPNDPLKWGYITLSGYNGYDGRDANGCPFTKYSTGDGYATISWLISGQTGEVLEDCSNPANDLDPITKLNYGIWQRFNSDEGFYNIELRVDDFEYDIEARDSFVTAGELVTPENNQNPDVSAYNDNVIIVSQTDVAGNNDIICYYSDDGMDNFGASYVASTVDDETNPKIVAIDENEAICIFIKDGDLYFSVTQDGGATWSTPEIASEVENVQSGDVCSIGIAYDSEQIVYFSKSGIAQPIIEIESISGGIGVSATIKNIGDATAENFDWSIKSDGLVFIGGEKSGKATLEPGQSIQVKTGFMLGFGGIDITVTADIAKETASARLLLFLVVGL
jgi:hypothetical protein